MAAEDWPLTGRDDVLRRLVGALRGGGAVLAGPAGVGKTRLAREVVARAVGTRGRARWAVASDAARTVPLGAFATVGGADGAQQPPDASLLARAATALRGGAGVVGVDDAHLLDSVSATLLHQLAIERTVRMVVTVRTGEHAPDAVTALWKDGLLDRFEVAPLTRDQTGAVLAAALRGPVDHLSVERLFEATRGNALWLRQLVDGEREAGRLASAGGGVWLWTGDPRLSPALDALIESRIGRLPDRSRQVLDLLALGEPLAVDLLGELVDQPSVEDVLDRGLAEATRRSAGLELRLAHPLFGEAVRARTGTLRARRLRGVLATALATHGPADRAALLHRAVLHVDSDLPPDPDLLREGAVEAATVTDVETAQRLASAARDAGGGFPAQLLLAFLLAWAVQPEAAEAEFVTAESAATTDDERVRVALARVFNRIVLDSTADLGRILDAAELRLDSPAARVDLEAGRALHAITAGDMESAARHQRAVLDASDAGQPAVAYAAWTSTMRAALQGWTAVDDAILHRGYAACARSADVAPLQLNMLFWETFGHSAIGEQDAARAAVARFTNITFVTRYMVEIAQIPIELNCGRIAVVVGLCRDAMLYAPGTRGGWSAMVHSMLCQAYGMAGDAEAAAAAWAVSVRDHQVGLRLLEPLLALAPPWLAAAEGAVTEAVRLAAAAAEIAFAARQRAVEMEARHAGVRFGDGQHAERLHELAALLPGPRPVATAAHAGALAAQDPDGLLAASAALEDCGLVLAAADAAAQAATLERERGRSGSALRAASRAAELAERCTGARTPALIAALTPLPITSREREIATLARAGLTNKQIGERLHVSVRTVEGHVYRACTKLGVADRTALADVVGKLR